MAASLLRIWLLECMSEHRYCPVGRYVLGELLLVESQRLIDRLDSALVEEEAARTGRSISNLIGDAVEIVYGVERSTEEDLATMERALVCGRIGSPTAKRGTKVCARAVFGIADGMFMVAVDRIGTESGRSIRPAGQVHPPGIRLSMPQDRVLIVAAVGHSASDTGLSIGDCEWESR